VLFPADVMQAKCVLVLAVLCGSSCVWGNPGVGGTATWCRDRVMSRIWDCMCHYMCRSFVNIYIYISTLRWPCMKVETCSGCK
jgi:hypothetical protein